MQELNDLFTKTTQGDWLFVGNDDGSISVAVRRDPTKLEEASVFMEISGATEEETKANARLVMLAKNAVPKLLDNNEKLTNALTLALTLMEKANVVVEGAALPIWVDLEAALKTLGIATKPSEELPTT